MTDDEASRYLIRSLDGLRVALAGFPDAMSVEVEEGLELAVATLGDLRRLPEIPHRFEILIPYRVVGNAAIVVRAAPPDYMPEQ